WPLSRDLHPAGVDPPGKAFRILSGTLDWCGGPLGADPGAVALVARTGPGPDSDLRRLHRLRAAAARLSLTADPTGAIEPVHGRPGRRISGAAQAGRLAGRGRRVRPGESPPPARARSPR